MPTNHRISSVMVKTSAVVRTTATLVDPCTGALGATSHRTSVAAVLSGHQSATGARSTGDPGLLPTGRPGPASLQCRPSSWTREGYRGHATNYVERNSAESDGSSKRERDAKESRISCASKFEGSNGGHATPFICSS